MPVRKDIREALRRYEKLVADMCPCPCICGCMAHTLSVYVGGEKYAENYRVALCGHCQAGKCDEIKTR
jgi:hypothetical protein